MQNFRIKNNRAGHVIILLATLLLMFIVFWAFVLKDNPLQLNAGGVAIILIIGIIGSVCIFMSIKMLVLNPDVIMLNEKGFEYNPGGISSGFMLWSNVDEIKFVDVRTTEGQLNGPIWEQTLAIKLKDTSLYRNQFNSVFKGLMGLNKKMYDADIFFRLSSFGTQAEEVHALMMQYWIESKNAGK